MEAALPERRSVVASGKTVEDAIKNGLTMLGVRREQVDIEVISEGNVTARDFVNNEEPLANLLEVMRYLMSHNGHLKTAIIP